MKLERGNQFMLFKKDAVSRALNFPKFIELSSKTQVEGQKTIEDAYVVYDSNDGKLWCRLDCRSLPERIIQEYYAEYPIIISGNNRIKNIE